MDSFFLFLVVLIACLSVLFLVILGFFMATKLLASVLDAIRFAALRRAVTRAPRRGANDGEGNLTFKQGSYTITYRLLDAAAINPRVKVISMKRRLRGYEIKADDFRRSSRDFWLYRGWISLFQPRAFFPLLFILLVLYLAVFETEGAKVFRVRWAIARFMGLPIQSIAIEPGGWIAISGQRRASDNSSEGIAYHINPLQWLVSSDGGYIVKGGDDQNPAVTYPVRISGRGTIQVHKDGAWLTGTFTGNSIAWEKPQDAGQESGRLIRQHELSMQDGFVIQDK